MSKSKKETPPVTPAHEGKGFLALAGEAFAVLGEEIIEGKDKVVEVTAAKITAVKKAIKKITHKKPVRPAKPVKKAPAKKGAVAKKSAGKSAAGPKKKAAAPKKAAKKGKAAAKKSATAPKKTAKKKSSSRGK
jgi:hypothetical protein